MPAFDGTGPLGQGPRTGGGFGYCPPTPGVMYGGNVVYGVGRGGRPRGGGRGRAFGGGRGRGRWYWPMHGYAMPTQISPEQELAWLKEQSQAIQQQLDDIHARIEELTSEQKQA